MNCSRVSQRFRSTSSRCATASTPPKPCSASRLKVKKRSAVDAGPSHVGKSFRDRYAHDARLRARPAQTLSTIATASQARATTLSDA